MSNQVQRDVFCVLEDTGIRVTVLKSRHQPPRYSFCVETVRRASTEDGSKGERYTIKWVNMRIDQEEGEVLLDETFELLKDLLDEAREKIKLDAEAEAAVQISVPQIPTVQVQMSSERTLSNQFAA